MLAIKDQLEVVHPDLNLVFIDDGQDKLGFVHSIDERTWLASVEFAARAIRSFQFKLGDLLVLGEKSFRDEAYSKAAAVAGRDPETLRNYAWVALRVPEIVRNPNLSFYHHRAVATLQSGAQMAWLARAEAEGLSVSELQEAIRAARPNPSRESASVAATLKAVDKLLAKLDSDKSKFFLCELINALEARLNVLDGVDS